MLMQTTSVELSVEEKMLICLSKQEMNAEDVKYIETMACIVRWDMLFDLAYKQGVFSLVMYNVDEIKKKYLIIIPQEILIKNVIRKRNINGIRKKLNEEMELLKQLFMAKGVKVVALKGYALNCLIYKNTRDYTDIDLLIDPKDYKAVEQVLKMSGFETFYQKKRVTDEDVKKVMANSQKDICEYVKEYNKVSISIDLHRKCENEFLDYIYTHAKQSIRHIYIPSLYDLLLYACQHALRHYPYTYRMRSLDSLQKLKDYVDVREIYFAIIKENKQSECMEYITSIGGRYIVNEILYLTQRLFGTFDNIFYQSNMIHDFFCKQYSSCFEYRLFYPNEEQKKIIEYDQYVTAVERNRKNNLEHLICNYLEEDIPIDIIETEWEWHSYNMFYHDFFGYSKLNEMGQHMDMSLAWDKLYLKILVKVYDKKINISNHNAYEYHKNQVIIVLNDDYSKVYGIQLKKDDTCKVYKNIFDSLTVTENSDILVQAKECDYGYWMYIEVPWYIIEVKPEKNYIFSFYLNVKVGDTEKIDTVMLTSQYTNILVQLQ